MFSESTEELLLKIWDVLKTVWHFELFKSGDSSVYFNQLVVALLVVVVGFVISRWISRKIGKRLSKVGKLNENTAHALQRVFHLLFIVIIVLIALPIAGIPITVFTVMGGAVAIGVGFGAQNLFNNLISGIILMIEKPIRIGDIVEVGEETGKVEDIGNRCVRVRRGDGIDVLIPNSQFLEQMVVNWTLSDSDVRGEVLVGVAYGSDTRKTHDLMLQAAREHEKILKSPDPFVLFEDFGDNSLGFRLYYWSSVQKPLDINRINSALRFRIDELFRDANIVIAFPQRDVHLDTLSPLQINLVKNQTQESS
ncbi:MAG: mechanosensitive ion channel [Verrucomicrobiae bacterium]|nr:mechanosensitive ion channel [Verrucomicrobiae bacterium]